MSFDVDTFVDNPSKMELYSQTKPQLKLVADKIVVEYEVPSRDSRHYKDNDEKLLL